MEKNLKNLFWIRGLVITLSLLGLAACGGSGGGSSTNGNGNDALDGGAAGVSFSMQLQGVNQASAGKALAVKSESGESEDGDDDHHGETSDDAGTLISLTEVRVHIRDVEFYLPEGTRCEDVQFTFVDPVRCDVDDENDEVEAPGDDDGTDDQGPGDLIKAESSDDDGTPDQGSGDDPTEVEDENDDANDDGAADDDAEDKVVVEGPFIADLINGTTTPSLSSLLIPSGLYTRIDVRVDEAKAEEGLLTAGDPLLGHSLYARGQFEYQGASHELRLQLKFSQDIQFENEAGIQVEETGANDVVVTLNEDLWFKGINLTECLDEGHLVFEADGSLVINEESGDGDCGDIEHQVKDNLESSGGASEDD